MGGTNGSEAEARRAALLGVLGNLILTAFKLAAGISSGSMALVGDSLHSLSDLFASALVFTGIRQARRPPDREHPFGHGDIEAVIGLFIAISLAIIAYEFGRESIHLVLGREYRQIGQIAIYAALISIVTKEAMARYTFAVAKKARSLSLEANAWDHRSDAISSVAVLFGVTAAYMGARVLDPIFALVMAVIIGLVGVRIGKKNIDNLIGTLPTPELSERIRHIVLSFPDVRTVHKVRLHYFGSYAEVDMHVVMDPKMTIEESHRVTDEIMARLRNELPEVSFANLHVEPR